MDINIANVRFSIVNDIIVVPEKFSHFFDLASIDSEIDAVLELIKVIDVMHPHSTMQYQDNVHFYYDKDNSINLLYLSRQTDRLLAKMSLDCIMRKARIELLPEYETEHGNVIENLIFAFFQVQLMYNMGINIHASAIEWNDEAILFSAPSGVGKSTQASLWEEYFDARVFNGDRPALRIENGRVYAYGTPWSGKDNIHENCRFPLKAIILVEQSNINHLIRMNPQDVLSILLPRFFIPFYSKELTEKALDIIEYIISKIPIYKLMCLPNYEAANILNKKLSLLNE